MKLLAYSSPFMPIDPETRLIWAILVELGYDPVKVYDYQPKRYIKFSYNRGGESHQVTLDISWAFQETPSALPLVEKDFNSLSKQSTTHP